MPRNLDGIRKHPALLNKSISTGLFLSAPNIPKFPPDCIPPHDRLYFSSINREGIDELD
jgi:hypothetical protein